MQSMHKDMCLPLLQQINIPEPGLMQFLFPDYSFVVEGTQGSSEPMCVIEREKRPRSSEAKLLGGGWI
eukprot:1149625-Pelagomonas_calceolata.AAC.5